MKQILGIFAVVLFLANCSNAGTKDGKSDSTLKDTATHQKVSPEVSQIVAPDTLKQGKTDTAKKDNKGNTNMGRGIRGGGGQ